MSKDEFVMWKQHPVTKLFFSAILENVEGLKQELAVEAGIDPLQDRTKVGAIKAFTDILTVQADDLEETRNGN